MKWTFRILLAGFSILVITAGISQAQIIHSNSPPPGSIVRGQVPYQPNFQPARFQRNTRDLQDYIEDTSERVFRRVVDDVDVNIHRGIVRIEIDARDFNTFVQVRNFIARMQQLAGYRIHFVNRNLENMVEDRIERAFGRLVDDVDVDADPNRRTVDIEVEVRFPGVAGQVRQFLFSLPELRGYRIRLDIEVD